MNAVLVDTDVLVEYLRGAPRAAEFLEQGERVLHASAVTVGELFAGARAEEGDGLRTFLQAFAVEPVTEPIAIRGGRYRREYGDSHGTGLADALIAATASEERLPLATFNVRHFPMLDSVEPPYDR